MLQACLGAQSLILCRLAVTPGMHETYTLLTHNPFWSQQDTQTPLWTKTPSLRGAILSKGTWKTEESQQRSFTSLSKFLVCVLLFCLKFCCYSRIFDLVKKKIPDSQPALALAWVLQMWTWPWPWRRIAIPAAVEHQKDPPSALGHTQQSESGVIRLSRKTGARRRLWSQGGKKEARHCPGEGQEEQSISGRSRRKVFNETSQRTGWVCTTTADQGTEEV